MYQNECLSYHEYVNTWKTLSFEEKNTIGKDSFWKLFESCFNKETRKLLLNVERNGTSGMLRLVLDDDKLHCDGLKPGLWKSIKRVKHVVCNRWGANVHTLAGSVSGIIYSISIEKSEDSILDCIKSCLISCFRMGNSRHPNLLRTLFGFDRGYGVKGLVPYITEHNGHTFGTVKRAIFNPYTYDQKPQGKWDKRIFQTKEGAVLVDRLVAPVKNINDEKVADLVSIFYRNGFGGATLLQSTLPEHQRDEWDRIPRSKREVNPTKYFTFFKPHQYFLKNKTKTAVVLMQNLMEDKLKNKLKIITEDQNVWEWFWARKFSQTASAADKYIQLGLKDSNLCLKETWQLVGTYYNKSNIHQNRLQLEEIIPDLSNSDLDLKGNEALSPSLFLDGDCIDWMANNDNLLSLSREKKNKELWKSLQEAFKLASGVNESCIDAAKIKTWLSLSKAEKAIYGLDTIAKLRTALKKRMPKGNPLYPFIKNMGEFRLKENLTIYTKRLENSYLDIMLSTSFMQSFTTKDTKLGHQNEPVIMANAIELSQNSDHTSYHRISFACQTGLIQHQVHQQMHASPDYFGIANVDGVETVCFIEIKCRTRLSTAGVERLIRTNANDMFISVTAGDENFHKNILRKCEKLQLLHQSATSEVGLGLFLIGDKNGDLIRGIWIHFPNTLIASYQACIADIHELHFKFASDALESDNDPMANLTSEVQAKIKVALEKQTYVDWDSFVYGFKTWVALRQSELPLLTSRRVLPVTASLWNRSKNGSDIATGMIRGVWFPLPTPARTPAALAIQRALNLIQINVLKVASIVAFKNENIDDFRQKTNKINGSFRTFGLRLRQISIVPRLKGIKTFRDNQASLILNGINIDVSGVEVTAQTGRRSLRNRTRFHISKPAQTIQETGTTPSNFVCKESEAAKRRKQCTMPILVALCDKDGKPATGRKCDICERRTKFWCLGCHRHFCNDSQKDSSKFRDGIDDIIKGTETVASVNLMTLPKKTRNPTTASRDNPIIFKFTCHVRGHLHLIESSDQTVARSIFI